MSPKLSQRLVCVMRVTCWTGYAPRKMEAVADRLNRAHVVEDRRIVANQLAPVERLKKSVRLTYGTARPNGA